MGRAGESWVGRLSVQTKRGKLIGGNVAEAGSRRESSSYLWHAFEARGDREKRLARVNGALTALTHRDVQGFPEKADSESRIAPGRRATSRKSPFLNGSLGACDSAHAGFSMTSSKKTAAALGAPDARALFESAPGCRSGARPYPY